MTTTMLARYFILPAIAVTALIVIQLTASDQSLFIAINGISRHTGDALWANWTILGDALVMFALLLPFAGRRPDIVWTGISASVVTIIIIQLLKSWIALPRPAAIIPPELIHIIGPALRTNAFPSGHTAAAFAFAGTVGLLAGRLPLMALLLCLAAGVGISRIAVGVHWPQDVLGGMAIGWLAAVTGLWTSQRWPWGMKLIPQRLFALCLLTATLLLLTQHDTHYAQAALLQKLIALAALASAGPGLMRLYQGRAS